MSSRGQGRAVLRPPPTDRMPSKFLDPERVEPSTGGPRRGGIAKEDAGGKHKAEGRKCAAESRSTSF